MHRRVLMLAGPAIAVAFASLGCTSTSTTAPRIGADTITATITVPGGTYGIDVSSTGTVYATVASGSTVVRISLSTLTLVDTVHVGLGPTGVAFSPDGSAAYVTNQGSQNLGVIDVAADSQIATIPVHADPFVTLPFPDGSRVVVTGNSDSVFIVSPATKAVTASLFTGYAPNGLAFNTSGTRLYVSNAYDGTVDEVDPSGPSILRTFTTGGIPQGLALSADGTELYVANQAGWLGVLSIASGARLDSVPLAGAPFGLARSPDNQVLYVGLYDAGGVAVVNRATRAVIKTLVTRGTPRRIAFTADSRHAVIANEAGWVDVVAR